MAEDKQQVTNLDLVSVSNKFVGISIAELVAAPLVTVCDSQKKLAQSTCGFMTEIGYDAEGKKLVCWSSIFLQSVSKGYYGTCI